MASDYEIPRFGLYGGDYLLGWLLEAQQEGQNWLNAQYPAQAVPTILELLSDIQAQTDIEGYSNVRYPKTKRTAREIVATLGNFRHEGEFKTVWDRTLYDNAHTLTNLDRHWYAQTRAHRVYRSAIQYAVATGTAYIWQTWDPFFWGATRGDIRLEVLSPLDVTFIQLPRDHDMQRAYIVLVREEMPLNLAQRVYGRTNPSFAAALKPDRSQPGWIQKGIRRVQQFLSPALRVAGSVGRQNDSSFPTVDIFHAYTMDGAINLGDQAIKMGVPNTNWEYTVPYVGQEVPGDNGKMRKANPEDCALFPFRRHTIFSRTAVCTDGSGEYWHAKAPIARLRFGDWAWQALGTSTVGDLKSLEVGIVELMRNMEDSNAARLNPPYLYDDDVVGDSWAQTFNPRRAGARAKAPVTTRGNPIVFPVDPSIYNVPDQIPAYIEAQEGRMDYLSGVRDLVAIAKAKQIPSSDTLEKLLEMAGPIVQDLVRAVEDPLFDLGNMRLSLYYQFYTKGRMITTTGPDGVAVDEQFLPELLLPYKLREVDGRLEHAESLKNHIARIQGLSRLDYMLERMRLIENFSYEVTESGINEINRMSTRLLYLQLQKAGFPLSSWTLAKICNIPNFGPPPAGTNTEYERWVAEQRMKMELQIELQKELATAQMQAQQEAQPPTAGGVLEGLGRVAAAGGRPGPGRPPSFEKEPRLVQKDSGTRTSVVTS